MTRPPWGSLPAPRTHDHTWVGEHTLCTHDITLVCTTCGAVTTGCRHCEEPIDADTTCPCTTEVNGL